MNRTAPGPTPKACAARSSASMSSLRSESPRYEFEFMRMNSRSPAPSSTKRGPRPPCGGFTATTTCSAPFAVPAPSRWASWTFRSSSSFCSGMADSSAQLRQHVVHHGVQPVAGRPLPLLAGRAVVDRLGPGVGDGLAPEVDVVLDVEGGDPLLARLPELRRGEVQRAEVIGVGVDEPRGLRL